MSSERCEFMVGAEKLAREGPQIELRLFNPAEPETALSVNALLDTGADRSMLTENIVNKLKLKSVRECKTAGMNDLAPQKGFEYKTGFAVIKMPTVQSEDWPMFTTPRNDVPWGCILGRDFLEHFCLVYNGSRGSFSLEQISH